MKKAFDQTVRDIKREVNKKVLKVPGIEQKVLDATSNELWGPHGSLLADIAQASTNYHEYQMTMGVIWKRISDTGKNWRHVYKALTVLEYMVAHGSERVIDEIRERAYQISTLSDFQYIDSSGRDQGSNVRKKSQSLVALVNDKERIIEVRQKAAANRDKFRSSTPGGMYRPGSQSGSGGFGDRYDYEGRYGGRNEDRSGYGREREYGNWDDDRYRRDGDRYSRDYEDRYGRDGYRDNDYRGRSRSVDNYQYGSRSKSSDRDRASEDDGQSSSRGSGARADDHSQDGRPLERKFSEQNIGAPPSYEEAVSESRSPVYGGRDGGETPQVSAPEASPPSSARNNANKGTDGFGSESSAAHQEVEAFDEFDPRGSVSARPPTSAPTVAASATVSGPLSASSTFAPNTTNSFEMDLLGSLSDSFPPNPLAIVPVDSPAVEPSAQANPGPAPSFSATQSSTQACDDPFGDTPFKSIPTIDTNQTPQQIAQSSFQPPTPNQTAGVPQPAAPRTDTTDDFGFGDTFTAIPYPTHGVSNEQLPPNPQFLVQEQSTTSSQNEIDILAGVLPPSGPLVSLHSSQPAVTIPTSQVAQESNMFGNYHPQSVSAVPNMPEQTPFGQAAQPFNITSQPHYLTGAMPFNNGSFVQQQGPAVPRNTQIPQYTSGTASQLTGGNFLPQPVSTTPLGSQIPQYTSNAPASQLNGGNFPVTSSHITQQSPYGSVVPHSNNNVLGDLYSPAGPSNSVVSQPAVTPSAGALSTAPQRSKDKFEPKSAVWADTLSRGLVNLNISGSKTNPLADIGVDFDAINRKEKRMEKHAATPITSTVTMGKAMGSGSGLGRAGVGALRPPPNPTVGSGMPLGGGYGGMNRPMGGMGQSYPMQHQPGVAPGTAMPGGYNPMIGSGGYNPMIGSGGYNPMIGSGGYNPQQPYGGGYR